MNIPTPVFDWRGYLPLAGKETSEFWRKQDSGKFEYDELLSVAVEDLATSKGVEYARKAIRGALLDFARDEHKVVKNVEMSEEEFLRTRGGPLPKQAAIRRVYVSGGVRHTLYTPGAYRTNAQLLYGQYKVDSKHGKVSVALERKTYNDEWSQTSSGWKRTKIEDEEDRNHAPRAGLVPQRGEINQTGYIGRGREKRFSTSCFNHNTVHKFGLGGAYRFDDGKVVVLNPNPRAIFYIPHRARSELAPHAGVVFVSQAIEIIEASGASHVLVGHLVGQACAVPPACAWVNVVR